MNANNETPVISVRNLVNRFGTQVVHDCVNLDVMQGEVLGIVGGSGTGKSVLLRTMLGLQRPASGQILVEGRDITCMSEAELLSVKRRYGVTFQHGALSLHAWWWLMAPSLCIVLVVLAFTMIGFAMDEIINPRIRER